MFLRLPILALLALALPAWSAVRVTVVADYNSAQNESIWRGVRSDDLPASLVQQTDISRPLRAYDALFPQFFFQEEKFVTCFRDCDKGNVDAISAPISGDGMVTARSNQKDAIELQNIYYWLSRFYSFTDESLGLRPTAFVRVMSARVVKNPYSGRVQRNNAFFAPDEHTLSFLPNNSSPLTTVLAGKTNRPGFDPSVIAHEAGHSLFQAIFPRPANDEITGLNEGFADYLANIFFNNPKIGLVMLRGKAMRDASRDVDMDGQPKVYKAGEEAHDLGELFSTALWKSRKQASDKQDFDRLVVRALQETSRNIWATAHTYKRIFLGMAEAEWGADVAVALKPHWDLHLSGEDKTVHDMHFLQTIVPDAPNWSLRETVSLPNDMASPPSLVLHRYAERWSPADYKITLVSDESSSSPRWVAFDPKRGNALGAWDTQGQPLTDEATVKLARRVLWKKNGETDFLATAQTLVDLVPRSQNGLSESLAIIFNGADETATKLNLQFKKKLAAKAGEPNVIAAQLITIPPLADVPVTWPRWNGDIVIGFTLFFDNGASNTQRLENLRF